MNNNSIPVYFGRYDNVLGRIDVLADIKLSPVTIGNNVMLRVCTTSIGLKSLLNGETKLRKNTQEMLEFMQMVNVTPAILGFKPFTVIGDNIKLL